MNKSRSSKIQRVENKKQVSLQLWAALRISASSREKPQKLTNKAIEKYILMEYNLYNQPFHIFLHMSQWTN